MNEETRHMVMHASRPVRFALTLVLVVLALFLLVKTGDEMRRYGLGTNPPLNTITVTGEGESTAIPNIAKISFGVEEHGTSVVAAQNSATAKNNAAIAAVKALGIEDKDIKTVGYSVSPEYQTQPCAPGVMCIQTTSSKITAYRVTQSIEVTIRDTAKAGDVLQKLGELGVQNVNGPNFTVDDDSVVAAEARGKAITDARAKAAVLAKQLGVELGAIISFSENGSAYPMYAASGMKTMDAVAAAPNLPVGQDQRKVTVQVTYQIH